MVTEDLPYLPYLEHVSLITWHRYVKKYFNEELLTDVSECR